MKDWKISLKKVRPKKAKAFSKHLLLASIFLILGFLLSFAFCTQRNAHRVVFPTRRAELIEVAIGLENERKELESELTRLRESLRKYEEKAAKDEGILTSFKRELDRLKFEAGLTEVEGPGIEIILSDNPDISLKEDVENYIVHDYDLRIVVNALWGAGAEAITINDKRLVSISPIRCVGPTILVNSVRVAPPYTIKAIGEPKKLKSGLSRNKESSQLLNVYAKVFGLVFEIRETKKMRLSAYEGSLRIERAKVLKGGK